jgi:cysteine desulfurase
MTDQTVLVCLMAVNNETGIKTPHLNEIGEKVKEQGAYLFIDAVSAYGKETFDIPKSASAIAFSAHKFHGPKGAGFLVLKQDVPFTPQLLGGAQEYGKRAGTENLAAILGMEKAIEIIHTEIDEISEKVAACRDLFEQILLKELKGVHINGDGERISNTSNLAFDGVEGESMLMNLDLAGVAVSHGSACTSGSLKPSHVLLNMGYDKERVNASIRFSFSKLTTHDEVLKAVSLVKKIAHSLREQFN